MRSLTNESAASLVAKNQPCRITCRSASGASAGIHTNVDRDLVTFLDGEIQAEREQARVPKNGPGVPGFQITSKGSSLTLVRKLNNETITVRMNVNGSVDTEGPTDEEMELQQANQQPDAMPLGDMRAKPDFVVEISKSDGQILAFNCRPYADSELPADQPDADKFEIEGFTLLRAEDVDEYGDWDENLYVGDAGIVDGQMYDLLMNFLDSRGIGNEFVDNLIDYATYYEHTRFIELLSGIKSFVSTK
jgi:complement component 1 Q subcomponent-binding protein